MKRVSVNRNDKFGRLTVVREATKTSYGHRRFVCRCECGATITVLMSSIRTGNTRSCGCLKLDALKNNKNNKKHGFKSHPLYLVWSSMVQRCYNKNATGYKNWGGRGIRVCATWKRNPTAFILWAFSNGWTKNRKKHNLHLDRIDNDGDYSPNNCRFVSPQLNINNRRSYS